MLLNKSIPYQLHSVGRSDVISGSSSLAPPPLAESKTHGNSAILSNGADHVMDILGICWGTELMGVELLASSLPIPPPAFLFIIIIIINFFLFLYIYVCVGGTPHGAPLRRPLEVAHPAMKILC